MYEHSGKNSDLVNQNCSDVPIPPVSESEVQTIYTDEPELDILSQENREICFARPTQVLESQFQQSLNLDSAISGNEDYSAISAQVSEFQRDQSVIL